MEGNGLSGRLFSNIGGAMLGLEIPLQTQPQPQPQPQQTANPHLQHHPQMMAFSNQQHHHQQQFEQPTQLSMKQPNNPFSNPSPNPPPKPKIQISQLANSDEDEPGCPNEDNSLDGKRKNISPWQRMKWTDNMVRLLIMAVYYIGDEVVSELGFEKKKQSGAGCSGGGGQLQKKGKWKSVSRAMMEKGFCVSPQQCEDKFNDLNKRYKRVNDILGKGTACKVVENQSLLETMDHLSPKMKEEVRKLLNSKHLFFREMCAYHNSCGHGTAGHGSEANLNSNPNPIPSASAMEGVFRQQQQLCLHSSNSAPSPPSLKVHSSSKLDDNDMDDDEDEDDEDDFEEEEDEQDDEGTERKRARTTGGISSNTSQALALQQLKLELASNLKDGVKSSWEKKQWVMTQVVQLEEQGVRFQYQALELEKQRMKWMKFSSKKEREMERMKIENERKRLENERMVLLLRQKEMELLMLEHRPSKPSCVTG